jgi:hypothetical protein
LAETSSSSEDDVEGVLLVEERKPLASRVILEVSMLMNMFEKLCVCPQCGGKLLMSIKTVCIASSLVMSCPNGRMCGFIMYSDPPAAVNLDNLDNRECSTDFAINVLYVVGFLSVGDGGT